MLLTSTQCFILILSIDVRKLAERLGRCTLTTRTSQGELRSRIMRCMVSKEGAALRFRFLSNKATNKFSDISYDNNVNITFYDVGTLNWATVSGRASVVEDKSWLQEHWIPG